jgi:hypothetical protein
MSRDIESSLGIHTVDWYILNIKKKKVSKECFCFAREIGEEFLFEKISPTSWHCFSCGNGLSIHNGFQSNTSSFNKRFLFGSNKKSFFFSKQEKGREPIAKNKFINRKAI